MELWELTGRSAIGCLAFLIIAFWLKPPDPTELDITLTVTEKLKRIDVLGTVLLLTAFVFFFLQLSGVVRPMPGHILES